MFNRIRTLTLVAAAAALAIPALVSAGTSPSQSASLLKVAAPPPAGAAQVSILNTGVAQRIAQVRREALLGMARLDSMARSGASDSSIMSAANASRKAINTKADQGVNWVNSNSASMIKALAKKAGNARVIAAVQEAAIAGMARIEETRAQSLAEIDDAMHRAMQ